MRLVFVLFLLAGNLIAVGQQRPPMGRPNQFTQGWNRFGYLQSDSGLIIAERDTTFKPRYGATVVYRRGDRKFYYYDSVYAAWYPLASDTTGSVNDKFNNLQALAQAAVNFPVNSILSTKGFSSPNDGGAAAYIISADTISGLRVDSVSQIRLPNGLFCILYHNGTIRWEQFGAKGDSVTNDQDAFTRAINFIRNDRSVNTILAIPDKRYRLVKLSTNPDSFEENCFLRIDFGDITFDFQGSKVIFDNNASQSYVYFTDDNGVTGVYRCKRTNTGSRPTKILWWEAYDWQIMQDSVVNIGLYPVWDTTVRYYGAMDFAHIGFIPPASSKPIIRNINWKNMEITGNEPDSISVLDGYWNINAKAFLDMDNVKDEMWVNVKMHNVISEVVYGGGSVNVGGYVVDRCEIHTSHNAISHGGNMSVSESLIYNCGANAIESFPNGEKQYYVNNIIFNCRNGITEGGPGTDINIQSNAIITGNWIYNCSTYGIYLSGKVRGCVITDNEMYDNPAGNISLYALSNTFPNVNSEIIISNNILGCYKVNVASGILINSSHVNNSILTSNLVINDNFFGRLEIASIEGYSTVMSSGIKFEGDKYRNISFNGNVIGDGLISFTNYQNTGMARSLKNNIQVGTVTPKFIYANSVQTDANPITFTTAEITDDIANIIPVNNAGVPVIYFKTPNVVDLGEVDFTAFNIVAGNLNRIVLMPGHDDNLGTRAKIIEGGGFIQDASVYTKSIFLRYHKAYKTNASDNLYKKGFEYVFSTQQNYLPDMVRASSALTGTLNAGDSITTTITFNGYVYVQGDFGGSYYDQFSFDSLLANNVAFNSSFQVETTPTNVSATQIAFKIKNISGVPQALDSKYIGVRLYPMSNPSYLSVANQPLRSEGRTNMRPVGSDVPNGFIYYDTQLWENVRWDANAQQWVSAGMPSLIPGVAAPTIIPNKVGDIYVDVTNKKIYFATGTASSSDWTIIN